MLRYAAAVFFAIHISSAFAQQAPSPQSLLPPNTTKAEFFGELLAVIAFCNLTYYVDQYELSAGMRYFGITSADRPTMEAVRDKKYDAFRRDFTTPAKHEAFCKTSISHPILSKVKRSGYPLIPGSDHRRQTEKIEFFGTIFGTMAFCKIPIDGEKWGRFLFDMGVQSESMAALNAHADKTYQALTAQHGSPQRATQVCADVRTNPGVERFTKR